MKQELIMAFGQVLRDVFIKCSQIQHALKVVSQKKLWFQNSLKLLLWFIKLFICNQAMILCHKLNNSHLAFKNNAKVTPHLLEAQLNYSNNVLELQLILFQLQSKVKSKLGKLQDNQDNKSLKTLCKLYNLNYGLLMKYV